LDPAFDVLREPRRIQHLSHTVVGFQICGIWECESFSWSTSESDLEIYRQKRQNIGGYVRVRLNVIDMRLLLYRMKAMCE
jgi:hypothetical protein